jgi:ribose transport system substrate-binding protein
VAVVVATAMLTLVFAASPGAAPGRQPTIVWLEPGAGNPYWDAQHKAALEAARRLGFSFKAVSGNLNASDQAAILRQLVDQKVDVVMVNAIDSTIIGPSLRYAKARGVKTLSVDAVNKNATASIAFDELRSGRLAAVQALRVLDGGKTSRKVAVLEGIRGQPASDLRAKGFVDTMKKAGVTVVASQPTDWQAGNAVSTMRKWLGEYPDLALVYAVSDTVAVPALREAARQTRLCTQRQTWAAKPSCIAFFSSDGFSPREVVEGRLFSTALYSPYWTGFRYAELAYELATGRTPETKVLLASLLVTPSNAACIARLAIDMQKNLGTFQFDGTLREIAAYYGCKILDTSR